MYQFVFEQGLFLGLFHSFGLPTSYQKGLVGDNIRFLTRSLVLYFNLLTISLLAMST